MNLEELIKDHESKGGEVTRKIEYTFIYKLINGEVKKEYGYFEVIRFN